MSKKLGPKYKLLPSNAITLPTKGRPRTLYRIQAMRDVRENVKAGDIGGYVESEKNLATTGRSWIAEDAWVLGNAQVKREALVCGSAIVSDDADVSDSATVSGKARVGGKAMIFGVSTITDEATIMGNVIIKGQVTVSEFATISDNARIDGLASIKGNARIEGAVQVKGNANIFGNATLRGAGYISEPHDVAWLSNMDNEGRTLTAFRTETRGILFSFGDYTGPASGLLTKLIRDKIQHHQYAVISKAIDLLIQITLRYDPSNDKAR